MKQQSITPGRERQCGRPAQNCQQQAFRQQLTRHAEAGSAKSTTNREFLLARRTAGQQQVGDVNASNEQHKSNGCHQSRHRCFQATHFELRQGRHSCAHPGIFCWVLLHQAASDGFHFCPRLSHSHASLEAGDGNETVFVAAVVCFVISHGHP